MPSTGAIDRSGSRPGTANDRAASDVERQRRIVDLLSRAVELDGDARRRFLDRTCAGDRALRAEIESMLVETSANAGEFLEVPAVAGLAEQRRGRAESGRPRDDASKELSTTTASPATAPVAARRRYGPYRVLTTLGQGGMGTVYLAEQRKPVRRRVALKVLDAVHDRRRLKRFAAEGQALARLNHPNIASLYEVGATGDGHPFVVMEPVEGVAITEWCDQRRLSLEERIELFLGACAGVRHAHEKGVLHRDLKPANVLVTEVDGRATAKVIDFGIARALGEPLLSDSSSESMTQENQLVGSPVFMCPEAARGERDLDTRSDVYGLGLVLYQLLTGVMPFDSQDMTLVTLLKRIARGGLPTPSARLAELGTERRRQLARRRGTGERGLSRRLRGDLDAITAKAVARDPEDRYGSPSELAADLRRHLEIEPVEARPATSLYVLGRFLHRRSGVALAAGALILALLAGFVARTREARRANLEAQRAGEQADRANREAERAREALAEAQRVSGFLVDLFEIADPERNPEEPLDVRQLLDRGAERLQDELGDQPLARALFLHTIGELYTKMALFEPAEELIAEALEIRERELAADHPDVLESVNQLGVLYRRQGRLDEAEPLLRRVLSARERAPEPEPLAIALALNNLGNLLWSQERFEQAEIVHRRALAIRERELGPGHAGLADTLNNLGALFQAQRRYEEARPVLERAAGIYADVAGIEHPRYAAILFNLALVADRLGDWRAAEEHCRQAATAWQAAYGAEHPRTRNAYSRLASLLRRQGRYEDSVRVYRATLGANEQALADDPETARVLNGLAISEAELGDYASAEDHFQRALQIYRKALGEDHSSTINAKSNLAWLAWRRGAAAEAEAAHRRVLERRRQIHGPEHYEIGWTLHYLARAIVDQGRDGEAEPLFRRALEVREETRGEDHREVADTLHELGLLAGRAGRFEEARGMLERALDIRRRALPADHPKLRQSLDALASMAATAES